MCGGILSIQVCSDKEKDTYHNYNDDDDVESQIIISEKVKSARYEQVRVLVIEKRRRYTLQLGFRHPTKT